MTDRLTLPNGDWVDLTTRLTYAQRRRLIDAKDKPSDVRAAEMAATIMVTWSIRGVDDQPIPVPARQVDGFPLTAVETFPADSLDAISLRAAELVEAEYLPKAGAGTSGGSPTEPASPSTSDSPTPTSLPITPDGPSETSNPPLPISSRRSA